jgi:predicted secreted protein
MHFEAIDEGETDLVMVYRRSFEEDGVDPETFQVHVVVK